MSQTTSAKPLEAETHNQGSTTRAISRLRTELEAADSDLLTMTKQVNNRPSSDRSGQSAWLTQLLQSGLDPLQADPRLFRQVKVLNSLMLTAMVLCVPLGLFWAQAVVSSFSYVYLVAFSIWGGLVFWLRQSHQVIFVGRVAVFVLFGLCTASVMLLGGTESNLLSWYLLMPLAAAVCVGQRDLWFWGIVATLTPALIYLYPDSRFINPSPFSPEVNHQLSGLALALGALVVSILTSIWMSHHERLAQRLDDSVARLKKEADAHRLLIETAMLASGEAQLTSGARKLLEHLDQVPWVAAVCFWDTRSSSTPSTPYYRLPPSNVFPPTPLLARAIRTGKRCIGKADESDGHNVYFPIQDRQDVVGVIEVNSHATDNSVHEGSWLLQQIAIQLGNIAERERTAAIIQREARYDSLTSLHNRRAFNDALERDINNASQSDTKLALLFMDLNDFKRINDSLGHSAGDEVLKVVAGRLQQAVRQTNKQKSITNRTLDSISRIGGDEFTLILKDIHSTKDADVAAQRILDSLALPIQLNNQQFKVGASIGIAIFPDDAQRADILIRSADAAMYAAKRRGAVGYSRYSDADKAVDSLSFEAEIRQALAEDQLEMHYQSVFSCATGEPVGAEALIRWHHPERGWVSPGEFIPLAESLGLIGEIGKFQFDTVLRWFAAIRSELPDDFRIALNLSPMQLEDSNFVDWLVRRLTLSNVPMHNVELEITETALLADTPEIQANVRALSDLGLCITLDDFGTGQSSLSLLKRFPIGRIKIDQSFVNGLPDRSEDVAIVGAVLSLAKSLAIPAVAEGVEEAAQLEFLRLRECDDMQGFLLARPMPGDQLHHMLNEKLATDTLAVSSHVVQT